MEKRKVAHIITGQSVVVHIDGQHYNLQRTTAKGEAAVALIREAKWDELIELLSPGNAIPKKTDGLFIVREDGQLYTAGDENPIHQAISKKLLSFLQEGLPCDALVTFWNNLKQNPSKSSIDQLYGFLEANHHPLTDDGCFLAYKKVTRVGEHLMDSHSQTFINNVGEIVRMDRSKVDPDPNRTCSTGLHVAAFEYAQGFSGNILVTVKVNPRDVVAIPVDYNQQKMRVCQYEVVEVYDSSEGEMKQQLVVTSKKEKTTKPVEVSDEREVVDLSALTAREAIKRVQDILLDNSLNDANLKNKQSIIKKAAELFKKAGFTVR